MWPQFKAHAGSIPSTEQNGLSRIGTENPFITVSLGDVHRKEFRQVSCFCLVSQFLIPKIFLGDWMLRDHAREGLVDCVLLIVRVRALVIIRSSQHTHRKKLHLMMRSRTFSQISNLLSTAFQQERECGSLEISMPMLDWTCVPPL